MLIVRRETPADSEAIHRLVRDAFDDEATAGLVDNLRDNGCILLSMVVEDCGEVVGHVSFSPMTIESGDRSCEAICLSPLAVTPGRQREGIGTTLTNAALDELRAMGGGAVFLLGHPSYYPRFGFRPAREFGVHYQDDRDAFMALELRPGALDGVSGTARFAPEFAPFE